MEIAVQVVMGMSLAACAGLRAFLPLLVMGLLERFGHAPISSGFTFLARTDVLVILAVATVIEIVADKIPVVDHCLDAIATFVRPVAGAMLASSMMTGLDPALAIIVGLMLGGGTALTVHGGKVALRATSTGTAPAHAGLGNTAISTVEDVAIGGLMWLTLNHPLVAFVVVLVVIGLAVWLAVQTARLGVRFLGRVLGWKPRAGACEPPIPAREGTGTINTVEGRD